jgi:multisubunit Na+/H+ antiporter MnhB subunit
MLWLKGTAYPYRWLDIPLNIASTSIGLSLLALLVMNFDRYLATYYPIFHRTSVTKGKLLTLLAILSIGEVTLLLISHVNVISYQVGLLISVVILASSMLFMNYKLFRIARKNRRKKETSPEIKKTFSLKNISSCLLSVACLVVLSIPVFVYIGLTITSKETVFAFDELYLLGLWAKTVASFNATFNCLIFYWKNAILRSEGMKLIKGIKICRRVQS